MFFSFYFIYTLYIYNKHIDLWSDILIKQRFCIINININITLK